MARRPDTPLRRLARTAGVADRYDAAGDTTHPTEATLRAVLSELGHACGDDDATVRSLRALRRRPWTQPVDPVSIVWAGGQRLDPDTAAPVTISAAEHARPHVSLTLEDGTDVALSPALWGGRADTPAGIRRRGTVQLPAGLPLGYHRITIDDAGQTGTGVVIVAPTRAPTLDGRRWGWMLQAYALRSRASWGQGEFTDLGALAEWSAHHGADFVLINPVHATAPVVPQQPSPYSPTSRRFANPAYLHIPAVDEFAALPEAQRQRLRSLPPALAPDTELIDRDAIWRAKRDALRAMYDVRSDARRAELDAFREARGTSLERFATFCALAEQYGMPFQTWPSDLQDPRSPGVTAWASHEPDAVAFHAWLQLLCTGQLEAAQARARRAGMAVGMIHDLAVGVDAGGADVWSLPEEFAREMSVGAPPDAFNEHGQDWAQPPPLPDAMRGAGYRTQREVMTASLSVGGGLRIDHILGLSRLFWIPRNGGPADGTYVRYPADEQFAVLALEARRAAAIVIGEDLGTVDDRIRGLMRQRDVAGSAVLYFETGRAGGRRTAAEYPRRALASVTTHDLPTATGWWDGSAHRARVELGLVDDPPEADATLADQRASMLSLLRTHGCVAPDTDDVRALVLAMHRFLGSTPSGLVAAALWDALGDPRQPNVPGTVDEYPNWRLPLARPDDGGLRPVTLEDITDDSAVAELIAVLTATRGRSPAHDEAG